MMKHDKVEGGIKIESEESENEMLDKYQPSDGFSDPINQFTEINEEETDDNMNEEYRENAFPSLYKYRDKTHRSCF